MMMLFANHNIKTHRVDNLRNNDTNSYCDDNLSNNVYLILNTIIMRARLHRHQLLRLRINVVNSGCIIIQGDVKHWSAAFQVVIYRIGKLTTQTYENILKNASTNDYIDDDDDDDNNNFQRYIWPYYLNASFTDDGGGGGVVSKTINQFIKPLWIVYDQSVTGECSKRNVKNKSCEMFMTDQMCGYVFLNTIYLINFNSDQYRRIVQRFGSHHKYPKILNCDIMCRLLMIDHESDVLVLSYSQMPTQRSQSYSSCHSYIDGHIPYLKEPNIDIVDAYYRQIVFLK